MSNSNPTVSLTLQIKGQQAGQELKKISDQQITATKQINQQWTQIGTAQAKFVTTAKAGTQATIQTARASDGLLRTNRMMEGVLRQQSIQTRIQSQQFKQQQATVQRLTNLMHQQQQSAQQLAKWMKQVESSSKQTHQQTQQTFSLWQKGAALATGSIAGGAIVSGALQKPRDYAQLMTYVTTTATAGQNLSTDQRLAKQTVFESFVKDAVRQGGGKREDAAAALNELITSGKYNESNVAKALLSSSKTAFAAGADAVDAAKMTIAMQNFGIKDIELGQDRAMRAGQVGSFEYKDLSKVLPAQMAMAKAFGYSGDQGLIKLLALNQVAKSTAADSSEAGNNVVNLLQKLSARELADTLADKVSNTDGLPTKLSINKKGKVVGTEFDWATYSIQQRDKGIYGVEAFVKLLEHQLRGNADYTRLQKEAFAANTPEARKSKLEDMSNIAMGSELGQFIADRQALLAAMAAVYNKDQIKNIETEVRGAKGTRDKDLAVIQKTEWAKDMAMEQEKLFAQSKAYNAISEALGNAKDKIIDWARGNEDLAATTYGATVAIAGLGAAAGVAAFAMRNSNIPLPKGTVTTAGTTTSKAANIAKTAGVAAAGYVGYELFKPLDDWIYGKIAGLFGASEDKPDFVKMAIEKSQEQKTVLEQQNQLIERQNQLSADMVNKLNSLISVTQQNKPVINMGGSLMDQISQHARNEEKRHGVDLLSYGQK